MQYEAEVSCLLDSEHVFGECKAQFVRYNSSSVGRCKGRLFIQCIYNTISLSRFRVDMIYLQLWIFLSDEDVHPVVTGEG